MNLMEDRSAPAAGYDTISKRLYRDTVLNHMLDYAPPEALADKLYFCLPSLEGLEIDAAIERGLKEENIFAVDRDSDMQYAPWRDVYPKVRTYFGEVDDVLTKLGERGYKFDYINLDLCSARNGKSMAALQRIRQANVWKPGTRVAYTVLKGRDLYKELKPWSRELADAGKDHRVRFGFNVLIGLNEYREILGPCVTHPRGQGVRMEYGVAEVIQRRHVVIKPSKAAKQPKTVVKVEPVVTSDAYLSGLFAASAGMNKRTAHEQCNALIACSYLLGCHAAELEHLNMGDVIDAHTGKLHDSVTTRSSKESDLRSPTRRTVRLNNPVLNAILLKHIHARGTKAAQAPLFANKKGRLRADAIWQMLFNLHKVAGLARVAPRKWYLNNKETDR